MKSFLLLCTGCLMAVISQAHIIYVPGDYPSIQQGINAATPGDTILVAEGTYYEQINFLGKKPLMVASEFLTTGNVSHIANTIIDGSLIPAGDNSSVVYFINGEDSTSVICGFTIQGGHGSSWSVWGMHGGGGVYCLNGASILNNIIQNNEVTVSNNNAGGGGILVVSTSPVHVSDNIIRNNVVDCQSAGYTWAIGGGIMCVLSDNCRHTIYGNIIEENEVHTSSNYSAGGGGILIQECSVLLDNNVLKNNSCSHTGSSISKGGALEWYIYKAGSCIRNNAFINNISGGEGGGVRIETTDLQELLIENNHFEGNHSIGDGGAVATVNSKVRLQNNVFSNNESKSKGGACYISRTVLSEEHMLLLINNSFSNNHAFNGGAVSATKTKPLILNSVFWNDSAYYNSEIYLVVGDSVEIANTDIDMSLISGGTVIDGGGNINEDPLYLDPVYLIPYNWSPIVDAGTSQYTCIHGNAIEAPAYQINGNARPVGVGYDMGAYDHEAWGIGIKEKPDDKVRISNYPNPFSESATFNYTLKEPSQVNIQIFDSFGRRVAEPVNVTQAKGEHQALWNAAGLPAGIYFYRVQAGTKSGIGKMIKQ